jgi:hypothetical protein
MSSLMVLKSVSAGSLSDNLATMNLFCEVVSQLSREMESLIEDTEL